MNKKIDQQIISTGTIVDKENDELLERYIL